MRSTKLVQDENGWETRSTSSHYSDPHVSVVTESVKTPTGSKPQSWTTVRRKAAVVIAPMTTDGRFVLVREERIPIRATIWSMPAGQVDDNGDDIEATAVRELREETGYELAPDGELVPLGHFFTSPGLTNEHCYFFLARHVQQAGAPEDELILECRAFSPAELCEMIAANEVSDSNTLSICARMAARGFFSFGAQMYMSI